MIEHDYFMTTERIGFGRWSMEDEKQAELLWGDERVTRYICATGKYTKEEVHNRLTTEVNNQNEYGMQYWPIFNRDTNEFLGVCGIRPMPGEEAACELGCHLCVSAWRKGYASEAIRQAELYAFQQLKKAKIYIGHHPENEASRQLVHKLGYTYIGDKYYEPTGLYHPAYEKCKVRTIGMLVAVEVEAVLKRYKDNLKRLTVKGFEVYELERGEKTIYIVHSGAGEIKAAAAVQMLIDRFKAEMIVNFGVVGGLKEELAVAHTCIVSRVVHYDFDTSEVDHIEVGRYTEYKDIYLPTTERFVEMCTKRYPELKAVTCASGDKFIARAEKKKELSERFSADICDMESAAIVLVCDQNQVPNLLIKTVSDSITGGADEFLAYANAAADICITMIDEIVAELG